LAQKLDQLHFLSDQIKILKRKIEGLFVQIKGAFIFSIQGIGVVSGAELYA